MTRQLVILLICAFCFTQSVYADFYSFAMKVKQEEAQKEQVRKLKEQQQELEDSREYLIRKDADKNVLALNKDWAVVVFFSSTCPHCKVFVPVVAQFIKDYGFQSQDYTLDGKPLEDFQHPIMASPKLIEAFFGDESIHYPAVFIVNVNTLDGIPISIGELTYDELLVRFQQVAQLLAQAKRGHHA